jgi:uncharacterized damage-inducible protein DinB
MSLAQSLLPEFDQEMAGTRKTLERIPEDKFEWRPHPKSYTMITLGSHIANMMTWGITTLKEDSFDVAPKDGEQYREEPVKSVKELLEKFDRGVAEFRSVLAGISDADMMKAWSLLQGGNTVFSMPRVACLRGMVFNHLVHHRAQLSVYLRMNDVPVPALYGPSADENPTF